VARLLIARGTGSFVAVLLFLGIGLYGAWLGGEYSAFVATEGTMPDYLARVAGFAIRTVTISGAHSLTQDEVIAASGIGAKDSLPFLNVQKVRARLKTLPLVKDASISKLYPGRVVIDIQERKPYALWQQDGVVKIVAADGTPIDNYDDRRFAALPLVVGENANAHIDEYRTLLDAAGDLRSRIKAGILVAQRRWTLQLDNQVEVALPEIGAAAAVAELAKLQREDHVVDKDILSIDLRVAGRMFVRLSANAAATRAALAPKSKSKGGRT
jgi:cell division protein FtsQ